MKYNQTGEISPNLITLQRCNVSVSRLQPDSGGEGSPTRSTETRQGTRCGREGVDDQLLHDLLLLRSKHLDAHEVSLVKVPVHVELVGAQMPDAGRHDDRELWNGSTSLRTILGRVQGTAEEEMTCQFGLVLKIRPLNV